MAISAPLCLHGDQAASAWRGRAGPGAWRLRLCRRRLPGGHLAFVLAGVAGVIEGPHAEELWRRATIRKG